LIASRSRPADQPLIVGDEEQKVVLGVGHLPLELEVFQNISAGALALELGGHQRLGHEREADALSGAEERRAAEECPHYNGPAPADDGAPQPAQVPRPGRASRGAPSPRPDGREHERGEPDEREQAREQHAQPQDGPHLGEPRRAGDGAQPSR